MNLISGYPFWLVKYGLPFDYPTLEESVETDVVVLGGGISGALVSYYLTNASVKSILVDSRTIGLGSSSASTSLLQYEIDVPLVELQKKVGDKNAIRSYKLCAEAIDKLHSISQKIKFQEFQFRPSLYYAAAKKDVALLKSEFDIRSKNGFDVNFLEDQSIKKEYGFSAPAAILSKEGAQTNAYMFAHSLLQSSIKKGLQVYDRSPVIKIHHGKSKVTLKCENGAIITAKKLVYATGYETVNYINKKILNLQSTFAVISEPLVDPSVLWKEEAMIWNTADPYLYIRTTKDRRILIGGRDEQFQNPEKRTNITAKKAEKLAKDFNKLFPDIPFKEEFNWSGTFGTTKDGLPYIGPYKYLPNSYFALGFGGNGIVFSQIAAEIITDLILGKENADASIFGFDRSK